MSNPYADLDYERERQRRAMTAPTPSDYYIVVKDGRILATHDGPCHLDGIEGVRYVPAATQPQSDQRDAERLDCLERMRLNSRAKGFQWDVWTYSAIENDKSIREQLDAAMAGETPQGGDANEP